MPDIRLDGARIDRALRPANPPLGYMVVRDEDGVIVADWDAESHPTYDEAAAELDLCKQEQPLYEWFLAELRPAEVPF